MVCYSCFCSRAVGSMNTIDEYPTSTDHSTIYAVCCQWLDRLWYLKSMWRKIDAHFKKHKNGRKQINTVNIVKKYSKHSKKSRSRKVEISVELWLISQNRAEKLISNKKSFENRTFRMIHCTPFTSNLFSHKQQSILWWQSSLLTILFEIKHI